MNAVASSDPDRRAELFLDTVEVHEEVKLESLAEKDFWVCWTLYRLFGLKNRAPIIFKGGTSLSKAYRAIRRFSEDIDLSLNRKAFGFVDKSDPMHAQSRKKAEKLLKELDDAVADYLETELMPDLREDFRSVIGPEDGSSPWTIKQVNGTGHVWSFSYPASNITQREGSYIRPYVLLEFGARSEHEPCEDRVIRPYAAESLPGEFAVPDCTVTTLVIERTFWEKVTLLHATASGGTEKLRPRMARHYYDVFMLMQTEFGKRALNRLDLLEAVVRHKQTFYRAAWASYEEARPGSIRLVPDSGLERQLDSDYRAMDQLFFEEPPEFSDILTSIKSIEDTINQGA